MAKKNRWYKSPIEEEKRKRKWDERVKQDKKWMKSEEQLEKERIQRQKDREEDADWRDLLDGKRSPINRDEMLQQSLVYQYGYPQGQDEEE